MTCVQRLRVQPHKNEPAPSVCSQQIEAALTLLEPEDDARCRDDIAVVLVALAYFANQDQLSAAPKTKAAKASARRLAAALRRVACELGKDFHIHAISREQILDWIKHYDALSVIPAAGSGRPNVDDKRRAVGFARSLLERYEQPVVTTKGSRFCRLAAVLHGTPKADFQHYCRESTKPMYQFASAKTVFK